MTYHYSVIQQSETGGALLELASGTINVQSGASKNVSATFAPADMGSRSKIVINLDNPAESISYWTYRSTE
jgi:hypothetical protein